MLTRRYHYRFDCQCCGSHEEYSSGDKSEVDRFFNNAEWRQTSAGWLCLECWRAKRVTLLYIVVLLIVVGSVVIL